MGKANKLSTCERIAGGDCSPLGGGLGLGRGTLGGFGYWFFRAASVEVAFFAERLCFANLPSASLKCSSLPADQTKNRLSTLFILARR